MLLFALAAALVSALLAGSVFWRAVRGRAEAAAPSESTVYARQLSELDEQKAQGLLDESGWRAARAEAGRRLLDAAHQEAAEAAVTTSGGSPRDRWLVLGCVVGAVILAGGVYLSVGRPGLPDQPYALRLKRWTAAPDQLDPEHLAAVLAPIRRQKPNDPILLGYLAQAYAQSRQYPQAEGAFEKLVRLRPRDAQAWSALGEVRLARADGRITPEARAAFEQALKLDSTASAPLWWLGREAVLAGRRDEGVAMWKTAAQPLSPDDPRRAELENAVAAAEAGRFAQAEAAEAKGGAAQSAMVQAMVERLASRLEKQGGSAKEWAQLVRAYVVIGDNEKRDKALAQARVLFAGKPEDLKRIEAAAQPAGPN